MVLVASLEFAEFLCSVVSDTGTGTIIPPQAPLQIIFLHYHGTAEAQHGGIIHRFLVSDTAITKNYLDSRAATRFAPALEID